MFHSLSHASCFLVFVSALVSAPALAAGSVSLSELVPVVGQSEKLTSDLQSMLKSTSQKISDITCEGIRVGRDVPALAGARVGPFVCQFARDTTLVLDVESLVMLPTGETKSWIELRGVDVSTENVVLFHRLSKWTWQ